MQSETAAAKIGKAANLEGSAASSSWTRLLVAGLLAISVAAVGCHNPVSFNASEVKHLDGLERGQVVYLTHPSGKRYPVTTSTAIGFYVRGVNLEPVRFESIRIEGDLFRGTTLRGEDIEFPVSEVGGVVVDYVSVKRAVGITFIVLIPVFVVGLIILFIWGNTSSD